MAGGTMARGRSNSLEVHVGRDESIATTVTYHVFRDKCGYDFLGGVRSVRV